MIVVTPGQEVSQHREDIVVYQLRFEEWSADLTRPDDRNARIDTKLINGDPLTVTPLPLHVSQGFQEVQVSGGNRFTKCEIVRIVRGRSETRRRSFIVKVL